MQHGVCLMEVFARKLYENYLEIGGYAMELEIAFWQTQERKCQRIIVIAQKAPSRSQTKVISFRNTAKLLSKNGLMGRLYFTR